MGRAAADFTGAERDSGDEGEQNGRRDGPPDPDLAAPSSAPLAEAGVPIGLGRQKLRKHRRL